MYVKKSSDRSLRLEARARELIAESLAGEALDCLGIESFWLNRHETSGYLPCLCRSCNFRAFETCFEGETYLRDFVVCQGRTLHYWVPAELIDRRGFAQIRQAMRWRMATRRISLKLKPSTAPAARLSESDPLWQLMNAPSGHAPDGDTTDIPF